MSNDGSSADPSVCQDLDYVKDLGKRIKDAGASFMLDFHYSDTWADSGNQTIPAKWTDHSAEALAKNVYDHTKDVLSGLKAAGITPKWVSIGNETKYGMLYETGRTNTTEGVMNFVKFINAGAKAVKEIDENIITIIHLSNGHDESTARKMFDNLEKYKKSSSTLWKLNREYSFRVIWTPRWTTNENTCHFFDYKDKIVSYCNTHKDVDFVFRPHPQAKLNFAVENNFSIEDFNQYEDIYKTSSNMSIDTTPDFLPLFYSADALISDFSSVIPEFFLTGKPIIYCKNDEAICDAEGNWTKGLYYARNWQEVESLLNQLKNGEDPLMQLRKELISSEFSISPNGVGMEMKELIKKDYRGE